MERQSHHHAASGNMRQQQQQQSRNSNHSNSIRRNRNNLLGQLLASLDLRFADSKVERHYYNYYAQVKRNLLPTAIQVVLLVNLLQLSATCLHFYLLSNESPNGSAGTNGLWYNSTRVPFSRTLILPLALQIVILVATFAMLKIVRAELDPRRAIDKSGAGRRRFSGATTSTRPSSSESNKKRLAQQIYGNDANGEDSVALRDPTSAAADTARHSGASGLSASLSLTIDPNADDHSSSTFSSSPSSSDDDGDDSDNDGRRNLKENKIKLSKTDLSNSNKKGESKYKSAIDSGDRKSKDSGRDRRRSSCGNSKLSRCKLSLPYILWLCQMLQLASGLWPQQSFISYSTLLLYSYTIYVIFPIRLMNCILLSLGLSLSQPLVDYLFLLNLQSSSPLSPVSLPQETNRLFNAYDDSTIEHATANAEKLSNSPVIGSDHNNNTNRTLDNSLLIPMTSHLSKVSLARCY